jgi:hypothetical protein
MISAASEDAPPERLWERRELVLLALVAAAAALFVFRYLLLREFPYPPSGDAGGDIYLAHAWMGHGILQLNQSLRTPPLYFFAIVTPFTTVFPTFQGIQLYMAFVPAILVFPAYLFVRESGAGPWPSVLGATLLGLSSIWSLMVTWNAAFNLFGIFLLLFFLTFLARFLRAPGWRGGVLVAVGFVLVGAAHPLTYLVAAVILATAGVWLLVRSGIGRLRRIGQLFAPSILLSLPLLVFYGPSSTGVSTSGGGSSFVNEVFWAFQNGPFFAWGYQGVAFDVVILLDLMLSVAALAFVSGETASLPFTIAITGVVEAAVAVILLDPSNAARGLYFLPIPFIAPIPLFLERALARAVPAGLGGLGRPTRSRGWHRPFGGSPSSVRNLRAVLLAGFAVGLLIVNANVSQSVMVAGIGFNESLRPDGVAAMDWVRQNTPNGATFIDGAGLQPWMWGYAERMDYAPSPLGNEVTAQSSASALAADYLTLGSFLLSDPYWVVASSYPSPVGAPQVFIATPGYWEPFLGSESDNDQALVSVPSGNLSLGLQYAALENATGSQNGADLQYSFLLNWTQFGASVRILTHLDGSNFDLSWGSVHGTLRQVNYSFGIPPSGYFFDYQTVLDATNVSVVTDSFRLGGVPFSVTFTGGIFTQRVLSDGWTQLWYWGNQSLHVVSTGMVAQNHLPEAAWNTSHLVSELGIDHAIVNVDHDYGMYERLRAGVFWSGPAIPLFQSGPVLVFGH